MRLTTGNIKNEDRDKIWVVSYYELTRTQRNHYWQNSPGDSPDRKMSKATE